MPAIAVLPGDGIGPEITREAVRVLAALRPDVEIVEAPVGGAALERGLPPLPDETRALCARSDAILFGSVGLPKYDGAPMAQRPEAALFALRSGFELYANLRPVRAFAGLEAASSLRPELVRGLDLIVVRELTGGIYFGAKETRIENGVEIASDLMLYRAPEIERIVRTGFELARRRRKHLTSVDKENVLDTSRLWRRTVLRIAPDYGDVRLEHLLVDNAAMQLVRRPAAFDVIVTENMFGDILSDEAAVITGSIGTLPSASLGPKGTPGRQFGMYEPVGGTAPDITGKGLANPTGAMLSAALLLRYSLDDETNASRIERAIEAVYTSGKRTADVAAGGAALSTAAFADAVIAELVA
ncbi:MAG TPA: 3-isopropylmalate dehydrogenase [Candidatus Acidoferrales bacterium]|nr:3-isopropylmalate dehydrogenase [Candidatus Acidoferrales bacterium]